MLIPNDLTGRLAFLGCGGSMMVIALLLYAGYRRTIRKEALAGIKEKSLGLTGHSSSAKE
jgi:hypothetical protein